MPKLAACVLSTILALCGCADRGPTTPYFLYAGPFTPKQTGPYKVSLCYSSQLASLESVREMVTRNCEDAALLSNDYDLYRCSLLMPVRAEYQCKSLSQALRDDRPIMPLIQLR